MKIAVLIARLLLGLIFFVFGLNPFLHFLPAILPPGLAGQFLSLLIETHYVHFIGAVQLLGGALLLANRYVPLALTLLGPVIVNILLYHLLLSHAGAGLAIFVTILWGLLFFRYRQYFSGLFVQRAS
jgi:putative oxidoreductase